MGVVQTFHCDCCEVEMPSSSVLDCVIVTLLEDTGQVVQHYYGLACGCGQALGAASVAMVADHAAHAPVVPEPEEPAPAGEGESEPAPEQPE